MNNIDHFEQSFVWKRIGGQACVRYVVLRHLETGRFAIQSADYFDLKGEHRNEYFDRQFVELMLEESPIGRCSWHGSVADAIRVHDSKFADDSRAVD